MTLYSPDTLGNVGFEHRGMPHRIGIYRTCLPLPINSDRVGRPLAKVTNRNRVGQPACQAFVYEVDGSSAMISTRNDQDICVATVRRHHQRTQESYQDDSEQPHDGLTGLYRTFAVNLDFISALYFKVSCASIIDLPFIRPGVAN